MNRFETNHTCTISHTNTNTHTIANSIAYMLLISLRLSFFPIEIQLMPNKWILIEMPFLCAVGLWCCIVYFAAVVGFNSWNIFNWFKLKFMISAQVRYGIRRIPAFFFNATTIKKSVKQKKNTQWDTVPLALHDRSWIFYTLTCVWECLCLCFLSNVQVHAYCKMSNM